MLYLKWYMHSGMCRVYWCWAFFLLRLLLESSNWKLKINLAPSGLLVRVREPCMECAAGRGEETMRESCRDHAWGRLKWSHWLPPVRPVALRHYPAPLLLSLPPFLHSLLFLVHPRLRASGSWADHWPHATAPPVAWEVGLIATSISSEQCGIPSDRQLTIGVVGESW